MGGHTKVTFLLLEVGADLNAKDDNEYTAVAHAEAKTHFGLMDRLEKLGGKGYGLRKAASAPAKSKVILGELKVSAQMLKSSSLGRISKVPVPGWPGREELFNTAVEEQKKKMGIK